MKRTLTLLALTATLLGCMTLEKRIDRIRFGENPYQQPPFYARYLDPANPSDQQILQLLDVLRTYPGSAAAHNELGALLTAKGFPNDAEREYQRAVAADRDFYQAWYNLGLVRESNGDLAGAIRALQQTLDLKAGHPQAHFQLGLLYEKKGENERALHHYVRAFTINQALLDIRNNPRLVDTKLVELAVLEMYANDHVRRSIRFQPTPADYVQPGSIPEPPEAPSPQPAPQDIVPPAPPVTDQSQQPVPPPATAQPPPTPPPQP